jgi:hypothetical protein
LETIVVIEDVGQARARSVVAMIDFREKADDAGFELPEMFCRRWCPLAHDQHGGHRQEDG